MNELTDVRIHCCSCWGGLGHPEHTHITPRNARHGGHRQVVRDRGDAVGGLWHLGLQGSQLGDGS